MAKCGETVAAVRHLRRMKRLAVALERSHKYLDRLEEILSQISEAEAMKVVRQSCLVSSLNWFGRQELCCRAYEAQTRKHIVYSDLTLYRVSSVFHMHLRLSRHVE